jgi:hypothetical protein
VPRLRLTLGVLALVSGGLLCSSGAGVAWGQCQADELAKLLADDGAEGDQFGYSVAICGDTTVIGAHQDDDNGERSGSAYVFRFDGSHWVQEARLLPADGAPYDFFGYFVAISNDTAVIGAYGDDDHGTDSGSAHVFQFDGANWLPQAKLLAGDGAEGDYFGRCLAIDGDAAVIGAPWDDDQGSKSGSAYVFRFNGSEWVEEAKLLPGDGAAGDYFGRYTGISGETIVVGAYGDDDYGSGSGSAYVFQYDGSSWTQVAKLLPGDGAASDHFGFSVAISGDIAVIGAYQDDESGSNSGSAYAFEKPPEGWTDMNESAKLAPSDGEALDEFGVAMALSGNTAVIGAYRDGDNGTYSGSAYIFRFDGAVWHEEAKLLAHDGTEGDRLGRAVAIYGHTAVVGSYADDDNGLDSGSVYAFHGLSDCQPNGRLDICDIAEGTSEDENGNGVPDECECVGDLDGDGNTDHSDLGILLADWGCVGSEPNDCPGDLDGDFDTDHSDLGILLADWGCGVGP